MMLQTYGNWRIISPDIWQYLFINMTYIFTGKLHLPAFFVEMKMNSLFNEISGAFNSFFIKGVDICKEFDSTYKRLYEKKILKKSNDSLESSLFNGIGYQLS